MSGSVLMRRLTDEQMERITKHVIERRQQLENERHSSGWYAQREKFERHAADNYADRVRSSKNENKPNKEENPFELGGNQSLNIIRGVQGYLLARLTKDLFGSAPFFTAKVTRDVDKGLRDQIQPYVEWKLTECDYVQRMKEHLKVVLALGEAATVTTWKTVEDVYDRLAVVLCDAKGKPILTADGDYVYEDDEMLEVVDSMAVPPEEAEAGDMTDAALAPARMVFAKDPQIEMQEGYQWQEHAIEERERIYNGLDISSVYWKDIWWPLRIPDFEDADYVARQYDKRWLELKAQFDPDGEHQQVAAVLEELRTAGGNALSEASKEQPHEQGGTVEQQTTGEMIDNPLLRITEAYFEFDCFEDGITRRLWMVLHEDTQSVIWVDYLASISPFAKKPIHLHVMNKWPHRSAGRGLYELYEAAQAGADLQWNALLYNNQFVANPPKVVNTRYLKGGERGKKRKIVPGDVLETEKEGLSANDILSVVRLPDTSQRTWETVQTFQQIIQVESGVTNANQGDMSGLPSNATATGINSMFESSSVLHQYLLEDIRDEATAQVTYAAELVFRHVSENETFFLNRGEQAVTMSVEAARQLSKVPLRVVITLNKARNLMTREAMKVIIPMVEHYHLELEDPRVRKYLRELYIRYLKGWEVEDADSYFPSEAELDEEITRLQQQMQQAQAQAAAAAQAQAQAAGQASSQPGEGNEAQEGALEQEEVLNF